MVGRQTLRALRGTKAVEFSPLALHLSTTKVQETTCLEVRLYSSVLRTMPQDSAKMGSKKAMSRGEVLW